MGVSATMLDDKSPADVEKILLEQIANIRMNAVTADELAKPKMRRGCSSSNAGKLRENVASELGEEMLYRGNLTHVNTAQQRIDALTADDLLRAKVFCRCPFDDADRQARSEGAAHAHAESHHAGDFATVHAAVAQVGAVPAEFGTQPPVGGRPSRLLKKGVEKEINGTRVIVMTDRLPT